MSAQLQQRYNQDMTVNPDVTITVLLFAMYRERLNKNCLSLTIKHPATVFSAMQRLQAEHPDFQPLVQHTLVAVNQEYADGDQILSQGDELALIPPVSGGSSSYPLSFR